MLFVPHYTMGMLQQQITEKVKNYVKWNYYLNPKNIRFPFISKEKVKLTLKYGIWSFSLFVREKKQLVEILLSNNYFIT